MCTRRFASLLGSTALLLLVTAGVAAAACGDGVVDAGEQCDPGPDLADDCCTATCDFAPDGSACLSSVGACDVGVCVTPATIDIVRIKTQTVARPNSGSAVLRGHFATAPPADTVVATDGVTARVTDGSTVDENVFWPPQTCVTSSRGGIRCDRPNGLARKVQLLPPRAPSTTWGFKFRMKNLATQAPFQGPVTVRFGTDPTVARAGSIATCTSATSGALNCRVP